MKNFFFLLLIVFTSFTAFSQECDDAVDCCKATIESPIAIPTLAELKCKNNKEALYKVFPKMASYKGYLFNKVNECNVPSLDFNKGTLEFEYCLPKTKLKMRISIMDFKDPIFKEPATKSQMDVIKLLFQPGMINPILEFYSSENKKFRHSFINTPQSTNGQRKVSFNALQDDRFYILIVIDGDKLKDAKEIDAFLKEYIEAFSF